MDPEKTNIYLDFLEDFSNSKQTHKFKRAFASINNKLLDLKRKYPNNLEHDKVKEALADLKQFHDYVFDVIFKSMVYVNDTELKLSAMLDENDKYAKILGCLGVTPMLYYSLSDESLDFVIDNYNQIGLITIHQLLDIDIALTVCKAAFKYSPKDYNQLKKSFNYLQTRPDDEQNTIDLKTRISKRIRKATVRPQSRRRKRS